MARFSIHLPAKGDGLLMDVQADVMRDLNTRVVIPLLPLTSAPSPARILNPLFDLNGEVHVLATQFLSAVPVKALGASVMDATDRRDEVVAAIDLLFQGF